MALGAVQRAKVLCLSLAPIKKSVDSDYLHANTSHTHTVAIRREVGKRRHARRSAHTDQDDLWSDKLVVHRAWGQTTRDYRGKFEKTVDFSQQP